MKFSDLLFVLPPAKTVAGFEGLSMRSTAVIFILALLLSPQLTGAIEVSGDQWGVWSVENNPHEVVGEVKVPPESTLIIEPGVFVNFKGHHKFIVDSAATLHAVGTTADSIYFTTDDSSTGWHGIRFDCADQSSELTHCCIEYGKAEGSSPDDHGGGVLCRRSSITISNSAFRHNSASGSGGGICLIFSSASTVRDNLFMNNNAKCGGGMRCKSESAADVVGNTFVANEATDTGGGLDCAQADAVIASNLFRDNLASSGGAISARYCSPVLLNNLVESNQASRGGGFNSDYSEATIRGNTIRDNFAQQGGGLYFDHCELEIRYNIISNNSAVGGGAIYSRSSTSQIENNTIAFNSASARGGGLYWDSPGGSLITSTILWGNAAPSGPQIHVEGQMPEVTYSDVQGGCSGQGNIDSDPLFVSFVKNDFSLRWHSCCIDAGNPDSRPNPDETRADIGALYFDQRTQVFTEIWPYGEPIVIPPDGGNVTYDHWTYNFSDEARTGDIWVYLVHPDQGETLLQYLEDVTIPPQDSTGENAVRERVYRSAPEGYYTVITCLGRYPDNVNDSSYFVFYKELATSVDDGFHDGGIPASFSLRQNYPNPFNAQTVISYQLPVDAHVNLQVYDLLGRRVVTLFRGKQQAGYRSLLWNASGVSSGFYFYKLTAQDGAGKQAFSHVKKMLLLK